MIPKPTDTTPPRTDHESQAARYAAIDREQARLGKLELQVHHARHGSDTRCGFCQE